MPAHDHAARAEAVLTVAMTAGDIPITHGIPDQGSGGSPAMAIKLLKEAGCHPCAVNFAISTSGSGQMQPLPMNELVKGAAGFQITRLRADTRT